MELTGAGLDDVVEVFRVSVAPLPPIAGPRDFTPGGIFVTDPPAAMLPGSDRCNRQDLADVDGYVIPPGGEVRLAVFMRAVTPGRYDLGAHLVTYELGGRIYQQSIPVGMNGQVAQDGRPVPLEPSQRACLDAGTPLAGALRSGKN